MARVTHSVPGMLHVVALAAALIATPASTTADEVPNIRVTQPGITALIDDARTISPTLAAMIDRVERSDVIVFVVGAPRLDTSLRGCVHFMGASGGFRYVRVQVKTMMNKYDVVASLAHELQHAIEISEHPEVDSEERLAELYRRIGHERDTRTFETDEAQSRGRAVRAEMLGAL